MGAVTTSRPYRSALREQQAEQTRELIAAAARARFLEKGWSGTSVRSVAAEAGVSEATIYAVYGSKAGLASSLIDAAEQRADVRRAVAELEQHAGDPLAQLGVFVAFDRRLYEVGGDVLRLAGEARRQHPDLGAAYDEGRRRGDAERAKVFASWPGRCGARTSTSRRPSPSTPAGLARGLRRRRPSAAGPRSRSSGGGTPAWRNS